MTTTLRLRAGRGYWKRVHGTVHVLTWTTELWDEHRTAALQTLGARHVVWAYCTCGWSDGPIGSPATAIASWRSHIEDRRKVR